MSVHLTDEQDEIGIITYRVILDHMDHGVLIYEGQNPVRAEEIRFAISYELERRE